MPLCPLEIAHSSNGQFWICVFQSVVVKPSGVFYAGSSWRGKQGEEEVNSYSVRVNTVNPLRQAPTPKMGGLVYLTLLWETVHQRDGLLMGDRARLIICVFLLLSGTLRSLSDIFYIWSAVEQNKLSLRSIKRRKLQSDNTRYCSTAHLHTQTELELWFNFSHVLHTLHMKHYRWLSSCHLAPHTIQDKHLSSELPLKHDQPIQATFKKKKFCNTTKQTMA